MDNTENKGNTMRAQFEAWWETTEQDVSFPHEAARSAYQAALSSPSVVALVDAMEALDQIAHTCRAGEPSGETYSVDGHRECVRIADAALDGRSTAEPLAQHSDDTAVDAFAAAMKAKLAEARAKGRGGWQDKDDCPQQRLSDMLRAHVAKGDPRDVANFCIFLHQRDEAILPAQPRAVLDGWPKLSADARIGNTVFRKGVGSDLVVQRAIREQQYHSESAQRAERQVEAVDPAANWPEDAGHENGKYECVCASCGRHFIGHKLRMTCRLCHAAHTWPVACAWPDKPFTVRDEPGEHDPCWLVMPDGASLAFVHHATNGVDQARAQFVADACNAYTHPAAPVGAPDAESFAGFRIVENADVPDGEIWVYDKAKVMTATPSAPQGEG
jgi:hypothetical protein